MVVKHLIATRRQEIEMVCLASENHSTEVPTAPSVVPQQYDHSHHYVLFVTAVSGHSPYILLTTSLWNSLRRYPRYSEERSSLLSDLISHSVQDQTSQEQGITTRLQLILWLLSRRASNGRCLWRSLAYSRSEPQHLTCHSGRNPSNMIQP